MLIGIWVARYLGPESYGKLSYILALVGMFKPLRKLGLDGISSREIAKGETNTSVLVSTVGALKTCGGLIYLIIVLGYIGVFKDDPIYFKMAVIMGVSHFLGFFETIELYFRAKVKGKFISISNLFSIFFTGAVKVLLIIFHAGLIYFVIAQALELLLVYSLLVFFFLKEGIKVGVKYVNVSHALRLLGESWPMLFSGVFALIYLYIDQIMIEELLSSYMLGQYSAAVKISSAWYFIPLTIGWSIQTAFVKAKQRSESQYLDLLRQTFAAMAFFAYLLIIIFGIYGPPIIDFLYGSDYQIAGEVLSLHIIASLFVFIGTIRGIWVTNESYFKFDLLSNIGAGILNIILNYLWIPKFGVFGAAYATILSYFFTYVGSAIFFPPAWKVLIMQLRSILLLDILLLARRIITTRK